MSDVVTMEKIVSLCKRRGFIFPSSEIYGGVGSTYDYGHYGVLLKTNVKSEWWRAMLQDRDDVVALDSAIIQHPRVWEARPPRRLHRPARRLPHLQEALPRRPPRPAPVRAEALEAPRRGPRLRPDRGARLQPDVRDDGRAGEGGRRDRLPAPRDGAGHLHQLQERPAVQRAKSRRSGSRRSASRSATRSRPATSSSARASSSRWRWSSSCRLPRRRSWFEHWLHERERWYVELGDPPRPPAPARARRRRAVALLDRQRATSSTSSRSAGPSWRGSPTAATSTSPSTPRLRREARVRRHGDRRALRAARDRARRRRRPRDARVPRRRLRRGAGRGRDAHAAAAAPAARAGQGRRHAARAEGRPARGRARGLRGAAPPHAGGVRRGRLDRQALPPPGRDRHAVGRDGRPPDARGPHRHAARPRHARAGAHPDRRARRRARAAPARALDEPEARPRRSP